MSNRLPKRFFYVLLEYGEGAKLQYGSKGGGKYTDEKQALGRHAWLTARGIKCRVFATAPVVWGEITPQSGEDNI